MQAVGAELASSGCDYTVAALMDSCWVFHRIAFEVFRQVIKSNHWIHM